MVASLSIVTVTDVLAGPRIAPGAGTSGTTVTVISLGIGRQGDMVYVNDALAPTYLATVVGGGSVIIPIFFDGTNWICY